MAEDCDARYQSGAPGAKSTLTAAPCPDAPRGMLVELRSKGDTSGGSAKLLLTSNAESQKNEAYDSLHRSGYICFNCSEALAKSAG
jgi:hypothetical protein